MKRGFKTPGPSCSMFISGYTIVETMVVLAVTAMLFTMAVTLTQGQQAKAEFNEAVRDFDSVIRDAIDDTAAGFFPDTGNFRCRVNAAAAPGSAVEILPGSQNQGTNTDCIFMGKALQLAAGGVSSDCTDTALDNCTTMKVYTIAGRARVDKAQTTNLQQADPTVIPSLTENRFTRHGLHVTRVYSDLGPGFAVKDYGSIAFLATLGRYSGTTDLLSGAQALDAIVVPNTSVGQADTGGVSATASINALDSLNESAAAELTNPSKGIIICLGGTRNQKAAVVIGANNRKLTTETLIDGGLDDRYPGICPG